MTDIKIDMNDPVMLKQINFCIDVAKNANVC